MHYEKILIIEDEQVIRDVLVKTFTHEGFSVLEAADGEVGLSVAEKELPDIILLDIILPKMHGLAVLSRLRESEWGKNIPVIILTNLSDSASVADTLAGGVYEFLVKKDWTLDEIVAKVREKLKK